MVREAAYQLCEAHTGRIVVARLERAHTLWKQTVGLLGRLELASDGGLWLEPCNSIHTMGMRFAIDVLFLDASGLLVQVRHRVKPWRVCWPVWRARTIIELPEGTASLRRIEVGKRYEISRR